MLYDFFEPTALAVADQVTLCTDTTSVAYPAYDPYGVEGWRSYTRGRSAAR